MAERQTEFCYRNIQLYKSESLGSGSYGGVCKAKCDGLLCAAKIMHPTLFDLRDPGTASYLRKFREECHLLSLARHPNVVQYLGTYTDPDTQLPVLLMELCDESLTAFLERSPGPLSYHIQVNMAHDIALALVYLHSNGLIHRDLTGNNVLMIAGIRAKITDFGMSKLATVNPRMTALTLCPGNILYMSPEALDEAKSYTSKLDVFSFGVIVVQILTRQFPNPTDRFRLVSVPQFKEPLRQEVPETERRQAHLRLIPDSHALKPLALQCLKKKENERPSAQQLSERLSELKQSSQYTESREEAEHSSEIEQLQLQLRSLTDTKAREAVRHREQITGLENMVQERDRQLQENHQALQVSIASRGQAQAELQASEQLVSEFQNSMQLKDKTIADLQRTISDHERKIQQLKQGDRARGDQQPASAPQTAVAVDLSKKKWSKGKNAPETMVSVSGASVVYGNSAFFACVNRVYSYQNIFGNEQWPRLPDNPNRYFGLAVIDGRVTSVGGLKRGPTNTLLSLTGEGEKKEWSKVFPPMPTPRSYVTCVTTEQALVVAGGTVMSVLDEVDIVEVMNTNTKQWATVASLPQKCMFFSAALFDDSLYIRGSGTSIFACSIPDLLHPQQSGSQPPNLWKEISSLPLRHSTLVAFGGYLLAVGGDMDIDKPTSNVYRYDSHTNSWTVFSQMKKKRYYCLAAALGEDCLIVVGGFSSTLLHSESLTDSVELFK